MRPKAENVFLKWHDLDLLNSISKGWDYTSSPTVVEILDFFWREVIAKKIACGVNPKVLKGDTAHTHMVYDRKMPCQH